MALEWKSDTSALLNGVLIRFANSDYENQRTTNDEIVVLKPKTFFDAYLKYIHPDKQFNLLEIGVFEGGSTLIFAEMFPKANILGVDLRKKNDAVVRHIEQMGYGDRVRLVYQTSQDDEAAITGEIKSFLHSKIDAVIDDASHSYALTRSTFEIVFPLLPEGAPYIIEDWGWAHWPGSGFDSWDGPTLSSLIMELVMASATSPTLVREVTVNTDYALVRRGSAPAGGRLDLSKAFKVAPRVWRQI